jgi:hypothetical protein
MHLSHCFTRLKNPIGNSRCPGSVRLLLRLHWWWNSALRVSSSKYGRSGSRWEPGQDCRGHGPGTPNRRWQYGWPFLLLCGVSHRPTHLYAHLRTAGTIAAPSALTSRQDHTPPLDGYGCLLGTHYSIVLPLTQHCAGNACAMKVIHPTTNEEGCLLTQNTVTPDQ